MIEVSVWYSAIKLTPSLPRAGHNPTLDFLPHSGRSFCSMLRTGRSDESFANFGLAGSYAATAVAGWAEKIMFRAAAT